MSQKFSDMPEYITRGIGFAEPKAIANNKGINPHTHLHTYLHAYCSSRKKELWLIYIKLLDQHMMEYHEEDGYTFEYGSFIP